MKPILLIVSAIVAFGSIVARVDPIDTEHLFGFTIGTDVGEIGEKELESNTLWRAGVLHDATDCVMNRDNTCKTASFDSVCMMQAGFIARESKTMKTS